MSFFVTFSKMVTIVFAIAMGFLANRLGFLNEDVNRKVTKLVMNITMPAMFLASVLVGDNLPPRSEILAFMKLLILYYAFEAAFMLVVPHIVGGTKGEKDIWRFVCMFPNASFIAYPLVTALLGESAILYVVILLLPYNVMNYSISPMLLGGKARFNWRALCTPALIASVLALIISLTGFRAPALVGDMLDFVGDATPPLALIVLGSILAGMKTKNIFARPRLWLLSVFRLLVMPIVLLTILRPMGLAPAILGVLVIEMGMPAAVNGAMQCLEYNGDIECMAQTIFVTTILSVVTLPLVAALL